MRHHLLKMLDYDYWANNLVFNLVRDNPTVNPRINIILNHIFDAQRIWISRLINETYKGKFEVVPMDEIENLKDETHYLWKEYLQSQTEDDMERVIKYHNTKGQPFANTLTDIVSHVLNHAEHHRSEIITLIKAEHDGIKIPPNDYIFYLRK